MANRYAGNNGIATRFQSGDEAAKAGRAGGIASGRSRRRWNTLREAFRELLTDDDLILMFNALLSKAKEGDVRAAEFLRDTMGEKPTVSIETTEPTEITFRVIGCSEEEAEQIFG